MRHFTLLLLATFGYAHLVTSQSCWSTQPDTTICGYELLIASNDPSDWQVVCPAAGNVALLAMQDSTLLQFSACGSYLILCCNTNGNCSDTLEVTVLNPDRRDLDQQLLIDLSYQDITCPPNVVAPCGESTVTVTLNNLGPPTPEWTFNAEANCNRYEVLTEVGDVISGCLVDSIAYSTSINSSTLSDSLLTTIQDLFILLDTDSTVVENEILSLIDSLFATATQSCDPIIDDCPSLNDSSCLDSIRIDTLNYYIPVHLGGQWTLADLPDLRLMDSTVFTYLGRTFELVLDPGVGFFGPGDLEVMLSEVTVVAGNINLREPPVNFNLRLQWEEQWTYDTIQVVRQIPLDLDGDCVACGGNFENQSFSIPGIPAFPCGPMSIEFPDECECDFFPVDYDISLLSCEPKVWELQIFSDHTIVDSDGTTGLANNGNSATFGLADEQVNFFLFSNSAGCPANIFEFIDYGIESTAITLSQTELNCLTPTIILTVEAFGLNGQVVNPASPPIWQGPGGSQSGTSIVIDEPGTYSVTVIDSYGCPFERSITVAYNNTINTIVENGTVCAGDFYSFLGQEYPPGSHTFSLDCMTEVDLTVVEEVPQITDEDVTICAGQMYTFQGQSYDVGTYEIPISSSSFCPDILRLSVNSLAPSSLDASNGLDCYNRNTTLAVNATSFATYRWDDPQGNINTDGSISASSAGVYTVTITSTLPDGQVCTEVLTSTVVDSAFTPTLSAPRDLMINCRAITDLRFVNTDAQSILLLDSTASEVTVSPDQPLSPGNYRISASSGPACTVEQSLTVNTAEALEVSFEVVSACPGLADGGIVDLNISGGVPPYTTGIGSDSTTTSDLPAGEYSLFIAQADGCVETRSVQIDEVTALPELSDQTISICDEAETTIELPSDDGIIYAWADGHPSPVRLISDQTSFDIAVDNGCTSANMTLYIEASNSGSPFALPNVINPNGYETNRTFLPIQLRPVVDYHLAIYDRLGNQVFNTENPSLGWDGTYLGKPVLMGSYTYMISSTVDDCTAEPQVYRKTGSLLVLR